MVESRADECDDLFGAYQGAEQAAMDAMATYVAFEKECGVQPATNAILQPDQAQRLQELGDDWAGKTADWNAKLKAWLAHCGGIQLSE